MTESIVVAVISGIVSLGASLLTFILNMKKMKLDQEKIQKDAIQKQTEKIESIKTELSTQLEEHKAEYIKEINEVHANIEAMKAEYQRSQDIVNLKIDTLSDRVEKHNNVIERTYALESETKVITEQIKVANHRIDDLEKK